MKNEKFPVCLSFDVDCQTIWTARDKAYYRKPVMLSLGNYGAYEGVPRILRILEKHGINATFNVPGEVADLFPDMVCDIYSAGNEIGKAEGIDGKSADRIPFSGVGIQRVYAGYTRRTRYKIFQ